MEPQSKQAADQPPPGHDNLLAGMRKAIAVPKFEIDKREAEWRKQQLTNKSKLSPRATDT